MSPLAPLFSFLMSLFGVAIVAASALTAATTSTTSSSTPITVDAPPATPTQTPPPVPGDFPPNRGGFHLSGDLGHSLISISALLYPDSDGDKVKGVIDWGDGTTSEGIPAGTIMPDPQLITPVSWGTRISGNHSYSAIGVYNIKVKAVDATNLSSDWTPSESATIGIAPANPVLTATVSGSNVILNWTESSTDVAGFIIYGRPNSVWGLDVGASRTYTDSGRAPGTYEYNVAAYNFSGGGTTQIGSGLSATVWVTIVDNGTPTSTTTSTTSTSPPTLTSCGSMTSGGGIKVGIYIVSGRTGEIYTDCVSDNEQQIQWFTCVEALSGTMYYPQRDNLSYSYTIKNPSGTTIASGNWIPSYITSHSSCPNNNGYVTSGASTVSYNNIGLQSGTPYTFTVSGVNAGETFISTAVFRTKSSTFIPTITTSPTASTSITTPTYTPTATSTQTWNYIAPIPVQTQVPVYTQTSTVYIPVPSIAPITALPFFPTSTSTQFSQTPVLTQAPIAAEERRIELESQERFFAERRAILQDLRAMERLVKQDIVDVDAKLLKAYKEKLIALKPGEEQDLSALQNYREKITELRGDEESAVAVPSFADPRAEAKALKQMKQGLRQFERYIETIEVKVTRVEKAGIKVDAPIKEALVAAKAMAKRVKNAKTYDDVRDIADSLPDIGQALNDSIPRLVELLRLPRIFNALDKNITEAERAITQTRAVAKKLKLDVADYIAEMQALLVEAKGVIAATKADPAAIDDLSSTLEETVLSNVDGILDLAAHIKTAGSIRQAVNRATADAKRYKSRISRLEKAKEDMQTASALLEQFNEYSADLKNLAKQKLTPEVGDQIIINVRAMGDLRDELEDILRLSKPDPLETEIRKLFSASGEKLKAFDVEKLEQ